MRTPTTEDSTHSSIIPIPHFSNARILCDGEWKEGVLAMQFFILGISQQWEIVGIFFLRPKSIDRFRLRRAGNGGVYRWGCIQFTQTVQVPKGFIAGEGFEFENGFGGELEVKLTDMGNLRALDGEFGYADAGYWFYSLSVFIDWSIVIVYIGGFREVGLWNAPYE